MRTLIVGLILGVVVTFAVMNADVLYYYHSHDEIAATGNGNEATFYRWVTRDGCTPIYGPNQAMWGLRCPRVRF